MTRESGSTPPGKSRPVPPCDNQLPPDRALCLDIQRVDRLARRHEQAVPLLAAEGEIGAGLRQVDFANQIAIGGVTAHAVFAWVATSFVRSIYQHRKRTDAKLNLIWDRNHKIRAALEAISPHPHTSRNQQSIRVIREEVDRIEGALKEVLSR